MDLIGLASRVRGIAMSVAAVRNLAAVLPSATRTIREEQDSSVEPEVLAPVLARIQKWFCGRVQ